MACRLKRFHQKNTPMFKNELKALLAVGVHPHVVHLLESFQALRNAFERAFQTPGRQ